MKIGLFVVGFLFPFLVLAQGNFPCSSFCVTEVTLDPVNGIWSVNISFEGSSNDFVNYPYVAWMQNSAGDTVAQGQMEYFGQLGGTSQVYHPDALSADFSSGLIFFVFDQDTCALAYPCSTVGVKNTNQVELSVACLPDGWLWNASEKIESVLLYGIDGKQVGSWNQTNFVSFQSLPSGPYFFSVWVGNKCYKGKLYRP